MVVVVFYLVYGLFGIFRFVVFIIFTMCSGLLNFRINGSVVFTFSLVAGAILIILLHS